MDERHRDVARRAYRLMKEGYSCSESTVLAVGEHVLGALDPQLVRASTALAGGVGDSEAEMCGALSGAILLVGAVHGRTTAAEDHQRAVELAAECRRRFEETFGSTRCATLRHELEAPDGLGDCAVLVERAAQQLLVLLEEA
jgi:C_GCAxxG_C_C family probable redox protein